MSIKICKVRAFRIGTDLIVAPREMRPAGLALWYSVEQNTDVTPSDVRLMSMTDKTKDSEGVETAIYQQIQIQDLDLSDLPAVVI